MYLPACGSFKSANHKKDWVCKSQMIKLPHLRKVHKSNKLMKSVNLRIRDLRNLFADRPPLQRVFEYATRVNLLSSGTGNGLRLREKQWWQDHHGMAARGNL
jgi:hypothetical protein